MDFTRSLSEVDISDVPLVGGKNASLGEMIQDLAPKGINVPGGYAVTAVAYKHFLEETGLKIFVKDKLKGLNTKKLEKLAQAGSEIRRKILETPFPKDLEEQVIACHLEAEKLYGKNADFAVRSSATAEDLPDASFAGEHETYLNISGTRHILYFIKSAMASLFTDRAISYRVDKGFDHFKVALSVGVQKMARSDLACSGIMFTLDTESGFPNLIVINASWGLGEMIVQGQVTPDEFLVFKSTFNQHKTTHPLKSLIKKDVYRPIISKKLGSKLKRMVYGKDNKSTRVTETNEQERESFTLTDSEILKLSEWALHIEKHYTTKHQKWTPMDIEWAKDGKDGKLYIVQARPETVHSTRDYTKLKQYLRVGSGKVLATGASVGNKIATGSAKLIFNAGNINDFKQGEILITDETNPDWEPIMKIASGIVTNKGGRTSHAAIVSRELGIPAVVGTGNATEAIKPGIDITIDTTGSQGEVLEGKLKYRVDELDIKKVPQTKTSIMVNIATPDSAFEKSFLPNKGVGLAREEFIIASEIGIHPLALVNFSKLGSDLKEKISQKSKGYKDKKQFFIDKLSFGIAKISAAFYPQPVLVRLSDFKTNEYRSLLGGDLYEPVEENPMIGYRGASRYYSKDFKEAFLLEIKALKKVITEYGLVNTKILVPFCRTPQEGARVVELIEANGLPRKKYHELKIYVMCEIPSNVILAEQFLQIFDGMSIGSNDLTQLVLGIDRDGNEKIRSIANENDEAVKKMISQVIQVCKKHQKYIGICGQAPSDYPDFAAFLVKEGIESISLNPDTVIQTTFKIHQAERKL